MLKFGDVHYQTELNLSISSERDLISDDSSFRSQILLDSFDLTKGGYMTVAVLTRV